MPMMLVTIRFGGWDHGEARDFVQNLETALPEKNPYAMDTLVGYMGTSDLSELKEALTHMLDVTEGKAIEWNASARDTQVLPQRMAIVL